jgi:hypothetical protein
MGLRGIFPGLNAFAASLRRETPPPGQRYVQNLNAISQVASPLVALYKQQQAQDAAAKSAAAKLASEQQQADLDRQNRLDVARINQGWTQQPVTRQETPDEWRARVDANPTPQTEALKAGGAAAGLFGALPGFGGAAAFHGKHSANEALREEVPVQRVAAGTTWSPPAPKPEKSPFKQGAAGEIWKGWRDDLRSRLGSDEFWLAISEQMDGADNAADARLKLVDSETRRVLEDAMRESTEDINAGVEAGVIDPQEAAAYLRRFKRALGGGTPAPSTEGASAPAAAPKPDLAARAAAIDDDSPEAQALIAAAAAKKAPGAPIAAAASTAPPAPEPPSLESMRRAAFPMDRAGDPTAILGWAMNRLSPMRDPTLPPPDPEPSIEEPPAPPVAALPSTPNLPTSFTGAPSMLPPGPTSSTTQLPFGRDPNATDEPWDLQPGQAAARAPGPPPPPMAARGLGALQGVDNGLPSFGGAPAVPQPPVAPQQPRAPIDMAARAPHIPPPPGALPPAEGIRAALDQRTVPTSPPASLAQRVGRALAPSTPGEPPDSDLVPMGGARLSTDVARAVNAAALGADDEVAAILMRPVSGYRTRKGQQNQIDEGGPAAGADSSHHRTGDAVDLPMYQKIMEDDGRGRPVFKGWRLVVPMHVRDEVIRRMQAQGMRWLGEGDPNHFSPDGR